MVNATGTKKTSKQLHLVQKDTKYSCLLEKCHLDQKKQVVQSKMSRLSTLTTGKWTTLWYKMFVHICCFFIPVVHSMTSWHFILFLHEPGCFHSQPEGARHATQHDTSNDIVKACRNHQLHSLYGVWQILIFHSGHSMKFFMKWWTESVGYKSFDLISNKSSLATYPSSTALFCCCHSQAFFQGGFGCC